LKKGCPSKREKPEIDPSALGVVSVSSFSQEDERHYRRRYVSAFGGGTVSPKGGIVGI